VRRCQKLPLCWTETVPAGSKTDLLLAKAKRISVSDSASVITYLIRHKNCCTTAAGETGVRVCKRNNSADTKVSAEGGQEVLQVPEQRFLCSHGADRGEASFPLQPWRPMRKQISTRSLGRTPRQSRGMPEGSCDPVGSPRWSRLLAGPVALWREEPMLEHVFWQSL